MMTKVLLSHPPRPASITQAARWCGCEKICSPAGAKPADYWLHMVDVGTDPTVAEWAFLQANWVGSTRADCTKAGPVGSSSTNDLVSLCMDFTHRPTLAN